MGKYQFYHLQSWLIYKNLKKPVLLPDISLSFLWFTDCQCCLLCDLRLRWALSERSPKGPLRHCSKGTLFRVQSTWMFIPCVPPPQESQGFISLNVAQTGGNKYINDSQLHIKFRYQECLHITVLAVLYCDISGIQISMSFFSGPESLGCV